MDKINTVILFSITVGFFFVIFSASSSHVVAFEDLSRNKSKSNNAPHIVLSHKDRASGDELVTLDASKSFDPDGDPIKFSWKKLSSDHFNIILLNDQSAVASFVAPTVKNNFRVLFELKISDGNGNADSEQFDIIISKNTAVNKKQDHQVNEVPASVIKKDQAEKSKTKSLNLSSIDRRPDSKTLPYDYQAQLVENPVKSPSLGNNKVKVNAGKDIRVASGAITTLHGTILTDLDSKQINSPGHKRKVPSFNSVRAMF